MATAMGVMRLMIVLSAPHLASAAATPRQGAGLATRQSRTVPRSPTAGFVPVTTAVSLTAVGTSLLGESQSSAWSGLMASSLISGRPPNPTGFGEGRPEFLDLGVIVAEGRRAGDDGVLAGAGIGQTYGHLGIMVEVMVTCRRGRRKRSTFRPRCLRPRSAVSAPAFARPRS